MNWIKKIKKQGIIQTWFDEKNGVLVAEYSNTDINIQKFNICKRELLNPSLNNKVPRNAQ